MQPNNNPISPEVLQNNPLLALLLFVVSALIMVGGAGFLASWGFVVYRKSHGYSILPLSQPWEPRRWSFLEVFFTVIGALTLNSVLAVTAARALEIDRTEGIPLELAAAGAAGSLLTVLMASAWICLRFRTTPSHVGFTKLNQRTVLVGIVAGLMSIPLMYVLMAVVSAISQSKYEHPLIESALENTKFSTYLLAVFSAAIAAPVAEEFFFRSILQGWLQSIPFKSLLNNLVGIADDSSNHGGSGSAFIDRLPIEEPIIEATVVEPQPLDFSAGKVVDTSDTTAASIDATTSSTAIGTSGPTVDGLANIYQVSAIPKTDSISVEATADKRVPPIWPSVLAGVLFGLLHYDYGMSFIPLSFLGIFLGWIYRQTHSIWPCIIIHMMLNSFSMLMLGVMILLRQAGVPVQ